MWLACYNQLKGIASHPWAEYVRISKRLYRFPSYALPSVLSNTYTFGVAISYSRNLITMVTCRVLLQIHGLSFDITTKTKGIFQQQPRKKAEVKTSFSEA